MIHINAEWQSHVDALWTDLDRLPPAEFLSRMNALADILPAGDPAALFERACANDSTGYSDKAVPLYRQALQAGLNGLRRRRAVIQLASSLRNLGQPEESLALLTAERAQEADSLDDAIIAFMALVLTDLGREREAASLALEALAKHLPRYNRSVANYAQALIAPQA